MTFNPYPKPEPKPKRKRIPVNKVSKKRQEENKIYKVKRAEFLKLHTICPITGGRTEDVHHVKGRTGTLFLDERYWLAVSREGHRKIEENPIWAKENGYSANRL